MRCHLAENFRIGVFFIFTVFVLRNPLFGQIHADKIFLDRQNSFEAAAPTRATLPDSFYSERGRFLIYFTTQGEHAVPADDENKNGVPDRVEKIAAAFEESYAVEILQLGYALPPNMLDNQAYRIYVQNLSGYFARTIPTNLDSSKTTNVSVSSYIVFDNDFAGSGYRIHGDAAIQTTAAHEFFHAVQMGYVFRSLDGYFMELTAVWMEDQVFDDIDNYRYFLNYFFAAPEIPLSGVSYTIPNVVKHIYGRAIWAFFIAKRFGKDAIRRIFEFMVEKPALEAMESFFRTQNSSFADEFSVFAKWNYFTGQRSLQNFGYLAADSLPLVPVKTDTIFEHFAERNGAQHFLTAAYYLFHPQEEGNIKIIFSPDEPQHWKLDVVVYNETINFDRTISNNGLTIPEISPQSSLLIVPCNTNRFADPQTIYYKHKPEKYYFSLSLNRDNSSQHLPSFEVLAATPNPFNNKIKFLFNKKTTTKIKLEIFNILGQKIDLRIIQPHVESWQWFQSSNNNQFSTGICFFRFSDERNIQIVKAIHNH